MGSKFDFCMSRSDYDDLCFDLTDDEHAVLDLRRRGMKYVGSVIIYSYLQAVGVINDHELQCHCFHK